MVNGCTFAPSNGAYPKPVVDPRETITPPLGTWFWLMSNSDTIGWPFADVIPVNSIVEIPAIVSAVIL